jgi:hypothetical protein
MGPWLGYTMPCITFTGGAKKIFKNLHFLLDKPKRATLIKAKD